MDNPQFPIYSRSLTAQSFHSIAFQPIALFHRDASVHNTTLLMPIYKAPSIALNTSFYQHESRDHTSRIEASKQARMLELRTPAALNTVQKLNMLHTAREH